uniref:YqaJ viral recombinase domain-containing protein n=1 Tax=Timema cristinae TaxID=61476 RepID=A0A7R9DSN7_TIMCR|nr:unnamed protein product [Timema cristinae]
MEGRNPPVKRKKVSCGLDQDYSLLEEEYSLAMDDDEHLVKNMNSFLNNLSLTEVQRNPLERDTVEQSSCPKWKIERMKRLTASNFGKICHLKSVTSKKNTDHALLYCSVGTKAMQYGIDNEPFAKAMLQLQMNINVTNCGLFVDKDQPFLVASPDGLVGDDEIVEIKCPMTISDSENLSSAAARLNTCKMDII